MFEGIYFANPNYLWLLLLLPVVIAWHIFTWKKSQASLKISSLAGFGKQSSLLTKLRHILFVFRILALGLIILAIARHRLSIYLHGQEPTKESISSWQLMFPPVCWLKILNLTD